MRYIAINIIYYLVQVAGLRTIQFKLSSNIFHFPIVIYPGFDDIPGVPVGPIVGRVTPPDVMSHVTPPIRIKIDECSKWRCLPCPTQPFSSSFLSWFQVFDTTHMDYSGIGSTAHEAKFRHW